MLGQVLVSHLANWLTFGHLFSPFLHDLHFDYLVCVMLLDILFSIWVHDFGKCIKIELVKGQLVVTCPEGLLLEK